MSGFALAEEGTSKCGNRYISMFSSTCHNHALIFTNFRYICTECQHCRHKLHMQVRRSSTSFFAVAHLAHIAAFGKKRREDWKKVTVSYDNMCHLNNLKVARWPLPLPGDLAYLWLDVKKIIDDLHIKNHRDPRCEQYRAPAEVGNTTSCEQTFAWLSRYKKILSAMPKTHHHFYLHRMVVRRNRYISQCYAEGRRPVQPKVRHTNDN